VTTFAPAYRVIGYEPRSEQSNTLTEPDVLSPIGGAAHSDPFQYATVQGLSGFQPYLHKISGRKGRYDPLTRKMDVGTYTVSVLDKKLATADSTRHVTAFLGDTRGRNRLLGCKLTVQESLDGGATWADYFTGRIATVTLDGPCVLTMTVRSFTAELGIPIFVGRPASTITYVAPVQLWPLGLGASYGTVPASTGVAAAYNAADGGFFVTSRTTTSNNVVTDALRAVVPTSGTYGFARTLEPTAIRARATFSTGALAGLTREYAIRGVSVGLFPSAPGVRSQDSVTGASIAVVDTADPFYAALPGDGDLAVWRIVVPVAPPTANAPLRIGDVHPVQLFQDLLDGEFSYLNTDGSVRRRVRTNAASFAALIADPTFGVFRGPVTAQATLNTWAEQNLCRVFGFAYRDNAAGEIEVVDVRTPSSLAGIATITDADTVVGPITWEQSREGGLTRIHVTSYIERLFTADQAIDTGGLKTPADLIAATPGTIVFVTGFREDQQGENVLDIDAIGLRWFESETLQGRSRADAIRAQIRRLVDEFRGPYGSGLMRVRVRARRTSNVTPLRPGALVQATLTQLPDPASNLRGGTRLLRVTEVSEDGPAIALELLDLGPASVMVAPTIGTLAAGTDSASQVNVPVTLNASSDPVRIEVAVTRPAITAIGDVPAAAWQVAQTVTATGTATVSNLPSLSRIWVRIRSQPTGETLARLPSTYVNAATAYIDTTGVGRPGTLSFTNISTQGVTVSWTNTSTTARIGVGVAVADPFDPSEPLGNAGTLQAVLLPGSTSVDVPVGLPGALNYVYVYYLDERGGRGQSRSGSWAPSGTAATATAPSSLVIL
jgi:hypothetical protein